MGNDVMARVTAAVQRGRAGDRVAARRALALIWAEVQGEGGDDFHRCVVAHVVADLQDDQRNELMSDERALAAFDGVSDERAQEFDPRLRVRGFLPSLDASLADDHRRLGDAVRAREFLGRARAASDALGGDAYGDLVRSVVGEVGRGLAEGSTERLPED